MSCTHTHTQLPRYFEMWNLQTTAELQNSNSCIKWQEPGATLQDKDNQTANVTIPGIAKVVHNNHTTA